MNLKTLRECLDQAAEYADGCDAEVEVYLGNKCFDIREIRQFGVVPTVTIMLGAKIGEFDDMEGA